MVCTSALSLNAGMKQGKPATTKRQFRRTFIRQWREYRDLTLEELAEKVDMSASHFSMLERGQRGYTQETLEKLAHCLQTSAGALLDRNPLIEGDDSAFWDSADPKQRKLALDLLKTVRRNE